MKTIYNVAVLMDSQAQCNRMKQLCIDNGLPIWEDEIAFYYEVEGLNNPKEKPYFEFVGYEFYVTISTFVLNSLVTEAEFIELLKQEKA